MGRTRKLFIGILITSCILFGSGPLTLDGIRHAGHTSARQSASRPVKGNYTWPDFMKKYRTGDPVYDAAWVNCAMGFQDGGRSTSQVDICMGDLGFTYPSIVRRTSPKAIDQRLHDLEIKQCQQTAKAQGWSTATCW